MAQAVEKSEKLVQVSARNVKKTVKKKFLDVLDSEKVGGQSEFINWHIELATSSIREEYFNLMRELTKKLKDEKIHTPTRS